jgi:hypothetical protein
MVSRLLAYGESCRKALLQLLPYRLGLRNSVIHGSVRKTDST